MVILLNENTQKFQMLCSENQSLFNNLELMWIQHWGLKDLVTNAYFHLHGIEINYHFDKIFDIPKHL